MDEAATAADQRAAPAADVPAAEDTTLQRMVRGWEIVRVVMVVRMKFLKDQGELEWFCLLAENWIPKIAMVYHQFNGNFRILNWRTVPYQAIFVGIFPYSLT